MNKFKGSKSKLKRAKRHIVDLHNAIHIFGTKNPPKVLQRTLENGVPRTSIMTPKVNVPEEIPLIIGDAIHNLRSCLDILAYDYLEFLNESTDDCKFPFASSEQQYWDRARRKPISRLGGKALNLIAKYKPYKGGNSYLRGLHDLDISDKHRLVIPISRKSLYSLTMFKASFNGVTTYHCNGETWQKRSDNNQIPNELFIETIFPKNYDQICVVFSEKTPFPQEPVIVVLEKIKGVVEEIIDEFSVLTT